ncbi:MAG: U32 family peptidase C-terminal domain-containing protein [Candidatus Buchananbacteria bacterium]
MNKIKKIELLAPAGDFTRLKYALAYGADAVYLGLPEFSLRAKSGLNFATFKESVAYAHKLKKKVKKKVYVTVNIFAHEEHIKSLPKFLRQLKDCQPDAIILSDPGVLMLVKNILPKMPIHLSTQANTLNSEAVKFWQKNGVKRIILGREVSLEDIKTIHKAVPKMELEVFVHGAMCMSYSGRCYLSKEFSNRNANLGACTQPCRWQYKLYAEEVTRPGRLFEIEEDSKGMYFMNSKDLCLVDYLDDLVKAGVLSFKIEGRTKSHYYVSSVVRAYREALDNLGDKKILADAKVELTKIDNRGYTTGFLIPIDPLKRQNFDSSKAQGDWQVAGEIVGEAGGMAEIKIHNSLSIDDNVEILTPRAVRKIKIKEILNKTGEKITEAHGGTADTYFIKLPKGINTEWGMLRKKKM